MPIIENKGGNPVELKVNKEMTKKAITEPYHAYSLMLPILKSEKKVDRDKEHFWVLGLSTRNIVQYVELVSLGGLNTCPVHPREVFRRAVLRGVASIVAVHNHPSDNTEPSKDDITLTRRLEEVGRLVGIELLDHVIITEHNYYESLGSLGLVGSKKDGGETDTVQFRSTQEQPTTWPEKGSNQVVGKGENEVSQKVQETPEELIARLRKKLEEKDELLDRAFRLVDLYEIVEYAFLQKTESPHMPYKDLQDVVERFGWTFYTLSHEATDLRKDLLASF
jgi:DNA repair protein RadC